MSLTEVDEGTSSVNRLLQQPEEIVSSVNALQEQEIPAVLYAVYQAMETRRRRLITLMSRNGKSVCVQRFKNALGMNIRIPNDLERFDGRVETLRRAYCLLNVRLWNRAVPITFAGMPEYPVPALLAMQGIQRSDMILEIIDQLQ